MKRRARLALAPVPLVLAAGLTGPAYAGHAVVHDPSHDVTVIDHPHERLAHDRDADITRFATRLTHRRLTLTLGLRRVPADRYREVFLVRTSRTVFEVNVERFGERRFAFLERADGRHSLRAANCAHLREHRERHEVRVTVPSRCLAQPAWVRTEAVTIGAAGGHAAADQAGRRGHPDLDGPDLGRRVHA